MAKIKNMISAFFMGKLYPVILAVVVTLGHLLEREMISATVVIFFAALALCFCDSVRPMFITVTTFTFQVTQTNTPAVPDYSTYYFTEWRLTHVIILGCIAFFAIAFFIVRNKLYKRLSVKHTQLLLPLMILAIAFTVNGFSSETWTPQGLAFGAAQGAFYIFLFLFFYLGISEREDEHALLDYATYIALIIALMIIVQMVDIFAFGDVIVDGAIKKDKVSLGWATCNPLGAILISLIPPIFYGALSKKNGFIYFIVASATLLAAITTCSRNALLFGSLIYAVCMLAAAFAAPKRWQRLAFRWIIVAGAVAVVVAAIVFWEDIQVLFASFFNQGATDNGRFHLWALAWDLFEENPLFGAGFFTLDNGSVYISIDIMPTMAHNTLLELLASTGAFGLAAYLYYRVSTLRPLIEKPTLGKTLMGLSFLIIAVASLLDIFVFAFYTMFYPTVALAVVCRIYDLQLKKGRGGARNNSASSPSKE